MAVTPATTAPRAGLARGEIRPTYLGAGVVLLGAAIAVALSAGTGAGSVLVWAIAPDLALLLAFGGQVAPGQLPRRAVPLYNLLHVPVLPLVLIAGWVVGVASVYWLVAGLTWLAHIGFDRGVGYGLRNWEGWQRG